MALVAGCASYPEATIPADFPPARVADTPFFAQSRYQCGPAALLTLLVHSGVDTSMQEVIDRVYLPGREGSLQAEIVAAARAAERVPYRIDPTLAAVSAELAGGRPVLVLQNLGVAWAPRWHYAVIHAVDPAAGVVRLRSGTAPDRVTRIPVFLRTWARSDFWGLVVLRPGELPADGNPERWFAALADMEETGHGAAVVPSWRAAHAEWPEAVLPLFALGNAALAEGDAPGAEGWYRQVLQIDAGHAAARNNLAHALAASGRRDEALSLLRDALQLPGLTPALRAELEDSLQALGDETGRDGAEVP